jgi:eukaryotic-like serine/threonine-protein kinase
MAVEPDRLIGTLVSGRYKVLRLLGKGGMGAVYEVEHQLIGRHFALKTLHPEFLRNGEAVTRFHREARAAAAIGDEHIIEVNDMGNLDDGAPFIVLELLHGEDLAHVLKKTGPMTLGRAIKIARQACSALDKAHQKGIVHRDIKPDNIFILERNGADFVKLLDFGISKVQESALGLSGGGLTKTGMAVGTPYYMAPEQVTGERSIDARADVYALGAVVFEMLMGRVPFDATTFPGLVLKVMQDPPPPICGFRKDVPPELEAVVHKALAKAPGDRFANISEFGDQLARFELLPSNPPKAMPRPRSFSDTATPRTWEVGSSESIRVPKRSSPLGAVAVVALLGLVGVGAWSALGTREPEAAAAAAHVVAPMATPPTAATVPVNTPAPTPAPTAAAAAAPATPAVAPVVSAPVAPPKPADSVPSETKTRRDSVAKVRSRERATAAPSTAPEPAPVMRLTPAPPAPAAATTRMVTLSNERRASVAVTLQCGASRHDVNVAAGGRTITAVGAGKCTVTCRGLGNPLCPLTIGSDARSMEIR